MPAKNPSFEFVTGVVRTGSAVQFGCVYCLGENLEAPADNHVAYLWQGTSVCASHFKSKVMGAQNA